jgi:hypothetical protein
MTKRNTYKRQNTVPLAGLEPTIPAGERPQTHTLESVVTGIGGFSYTQNFMQDILLKVCFSKCYQIVDENYLLMTN